MKKIRTACSLDCWDACAIEITMEDHQVVKVQGDPNHPITKGFLCQKGMKHLERVLSEDRLTSPMKKENGTWIPIGWEMAIQEIGAKLKEIRDNFGSSSLLHYKDSGHGGVVKSIDNAFFNSYGGATLPKGSLCWSAGIAAQKLDFGKPLSHNPDDYSNAKTILIWGRNPVDTNIHLVPYLKRAKENGANIVVIDPIKTATAYLGTHYYPIKPEADGFLAIAMAKIILSEGDEDTTFIDDHSRGFQEYQQYIDTFSMDALVDKIGISLEEILELTALYKNKPSAIILGYGLQRYYNGGKNIRFIDALAALTGNIGIAGGGVSYANKRVVEWIDDAYASNTLAFEPPTFKRALFADYVLENAPNRIKGIFVTTSNPVVQLPDTTRTIEAFKAIPFKVTIDHFMTDTAQLSDYVLPATHIYEEEDFIYSSMWQPYFRYTERVLPPRDGVKSEFQIFKLLAQEMGMTDFLQKYPDEKTYLNKSLAPLLEKLNLSLEEIQGKSLTIAEEDIPWKDKKFNTPSGKFQFINPVEEDLEFISIQNHEYPLHLLSVHPKHSLHSQHFKDEDPNTLPKVYGSAKTFQRYGVLEGQEITLSSKDGKIHALSIFSENIREDVLMIQEGWWLKNQGVNRMTSTGVSDIGNQAVFNNCLCKIVK